VILYSALLLAIVNLKLSIHHLRKSDIYLLHKEYYFSCMAERSVFLSLKRPSLYPAKVYHSLPHGTISLSLKHLSFHRSKVWQESLLHTALHA